MHFTATKKPLKYFATDGHLGKWKKQLKDLTTNIRFRTFPDKIITIIYLFISNLQTLHTNKQTTRKKKKIKGPREKLKDHIPIRYWRVAESASSQAISSNIQ